MKAKVYVNLKSGVLDPQGKAIQHSVELLGFSGFRTSGRVNTSKSPSTARSTTSKPANPSKRWPVKSCQTP